MTPLPTSPGGTTSSPPPSEGEGSFPTDGYFAGFFDGEGCVGIARTLAKVGVQKGSWKYSWHITVTQVDRRPLYQFAARWGGHVYSKRSWYVWKVTNRHAALRFLRAILPHLIVKKAEVQALFTYLVETYPPKGRWGVHAPIPDEVHKLRMALIEECGRHKRYIRKNFEYWNRLEQERQEVLAEKEGK